MRGKTARVNFTAGRLREFACAPGKATSFLWDSGVPGLGLRTTSAGAKAYIYQARLPDPDGGSSTFRLTIGAFDSLTLDAARKRARDLAAMVAAGIDPRREIRQQAAARVAEQRQERMGAIAFGEVFLHYVEANKGRWSARYLLDNQRSIDPGGRPAIRAGKGKTIKPGPLAGLARMKLAQLGPDEVVSWLKRESATRPTRARNSFSHLRACLNWAAGHPDYRGAVNLDAVGRAVTRLALPPNRAKSDCLQKEQLRGWFSEVRKTYNPIVAAFLQALLLTGARRNELERLRWENVDFRWRSMTIHDKVEGSRIVPLCPYLAVLLSALPRNNTFVFSSTTSSSGHITDATRAHRQACQGAGIEDLSLHGLRRSFGTLCEWLECPTGVVAQIMGHKPSAIAEKHYRRRPLDLLRKWHTKIEAWILGQAGIEQPEENADLQPLRVVK